MICHTIPSSWLAVIRGEEDDHPELNEIRAFESVILTGRKLSHVDSSYSFAGIVRTFWTIDPLEALKHAYQDRNESGTADIMEWINNDDEWFAEEVVRPFLVNVKAKRPDIWTYAVMLSGRDGMNNHPTWIDPGAEENMPRAAYWLYYAVLEYLDRGYHVYDL